MSSKKPETSSSNNDLVERIAVVVSRSLNFNLNNRLLATKLISDASDASNINEFKTKWTTRGLPLDNKFQQNAAQEVWELVNGDRDSKDRFGFGFSNKVETLETKELKGGLFRHKGASVGIHGMLTFRTLEKVNHRRSVSNHSQKN